MAERKRANLSFDEQMRPVMDMVRSNPHVIENPMLGAEVHATMVRVCNGDEERARHELGRRVVALSCQRDELLSAFKAIKSQRPQLAWCLSVAFTHGTNGSTRRMIYAMPLSRDASPPDCFEVIDAVVGGDEPHAGKASRHADNGNGNAKLPDPPFLAIVDPANKLFLGTAADLPKPPLRSELLEAIAARAGEGPMGEIEVLDGPERKYTVFAPKALAAEAAAKLGEGEGVIVRVSSGIATGIHQSDDKKSEDWLEFPPLDGPSVADLVFPNWLKSEWQRDVRAMAKGRPLRVNLIGPTGVGKSDGVVRAGRDAARIAMAEGHCKGFALIRISSSHIGSSYIHQTERNLLQAINRARSLAGKGYLCIILCDEADAMFGEMEGAEHSHNRSERLEAQQLLSQDIPGVAVYLTMNPRRNSWLPAAISRRFRKRIYPRTSRSQMAAVAARYAGPETLAALGMGAEEFGGVFADNLFADSRVVATGHMHSGRKLIIRARDLHNASPGKVRDLLEVFNNDVADGEAKGIESLWRMLDREFRATELNVRNLYELTFCPQSPDDSLRTVETVA